MDTGIVVYGMQVGVVVGIAMIVASIILFTFVAVIGLISIAFGKGKDKEEQ